MPAPVPLWHEVLGHLQTVMRPAGVRRTSVVRLGLLVLGILAAKSTVLAQMADELFALKVTAAAEPEHIGRRLRRALNDPALEAATCYAPAVAAAIDWEAIRADSGVVRLIVDESSQDERVHLVRVSLAYWGGAVPLAWAVWEQNTPLPPGAYWRHVDAVLAAVAALVPRGPALPVIVTADRAFDIPAFIDRVAARGWHWVVRAKGRSSLRVRTAAGRAQGLRALVRQVAPRPGHLWKGRRQVFKGAGWREASMLVQWAVGAAEPLVVLTDLPPRWPVLAHYDWRFWTEPGCRTDKTHGWQWEASQVQGVAHHARLLVAMAWASLLTLIAGVEAAHDRLRRLAQRPRRPRPAGRVSRPQHARQSVFTLGLRRLRGWLYHAGAAWPTALAGRLVDPGAPAWTRRWSAAQARRSILASVRP